MNKERIFVMLKAFEEWELKTTIDSAIDNAIFPERIDFGICEQRCDYNFEDFSDSKYKNVISLRMACEVPMGIGLAGAIATSLHSYQEYTLEIDSHTLFKRGWDVAIIAEFKRLKQICKKPVISHRILDWNRDEGGLIIKSDETLKPDSLIPKKIKIELDSLELHRENKEKFYTRTVMSNKKIRANKFPHQHYLTSGALRFANTKFFIDVLWNLDIAFYGGEEITALRAWTHGYKIFVIENHYFWSKGRKIKKDNEIDLSGGDIAWRRYTEKRNNDERFKYSPTTYMYEANAIHSTVHRILTGEITGYWGAKSRRRYSKYLRRLGLDLRKIHTPIGNKDYIEKIKKYES
jgi:hypothetical protein